jgi:hypothetical protein
MQNPGYWRRPSSKDFALQDPLNAQPTENNIEKDILSNSALQDLLTVQPTVIIDLIANFIGSAFSPFKVVLRAEY